MMRRIWRLSVCVAWLFMLSACGKEVQTTPSTEESSEKNRQIGILVEMEGIEQKAESLRTAMADWTEAEVVLVSDRTEVEDCIIISDAGSGYIGGLREKEYGIQFSEHEVILEGSNQSTAEKAVDVLISDYLSAWTDEALFSGEPEDLRYVSTVYGLGYLEIQGAKLWDYVIVRGEQPEDAKFLQQLIENSSTYVLPIVSADELEEGTPAFIFGSSGAREAEIYSEDLAEGECRIAGSGSDVYFCAGAKEDEIIAMKMFIGKYLDYNYKSDKALNRTVEIEEDFQLKFSLNFDGTPGWVSQINLVANVQYQGDWCVLQGGCTDGTYAYYALSPQSGNTQSGKIVKMKVSDWSIVEVSDKLETGHSNAMTYNTKTDRIIVVHYKPDHQSLSIVNPDTLNVEQTIDTGISSLYSIGYSEKSDQYICGINGSKSKFAILDSEFNLVKIVDGNYSVDYSNQSCYADDNYVYSIRSGAFNRTDETNVQRDNCIVVSDWDGNLVGQIILDSRAEAENLFRVGKLWYTGYYLSGGAVYETIIYKEIR